TRGAIDEAVEQLHGEGVRVNSAHIRLLHPFPTEQLKTHIESAKQVLVVENNATGQLADIIKMNVGHANKIKNLLKYNGEPFYASDIKNDVEELITYERVNH